MVRVREARRAFRKFYATCFWSYRAELDIGPADVEWVAETLKKNGDMRAWRAARRLVPHDSAWRFMPTVQDEMGGYVLHDVDLAINKVLALAGRDEARDFVDTLYAHDRILPLGAMVWAAVAKDPGFTPVSLLEQLKRRGRQRPEDIGRLDLAVPFDPIEAKAAWLAALADAEAFVRSRPAEEVGCLYYSSHCDRFTAPSPDVSLAKQGLVVHYGQSGGVLPRPADADADAPG